MFQNYLKIAWRNLIRYKLHTAINVVGLAIGISACFTIFQIVKYENSFDTFHPDGDRIYRIYTQFSGLFEGFNSGVCAPLPLAIKDQVPGIEITAPFHTLYEPKVEANFANGDRKTFIEQKAVAFMPPEYFEIFQSYEWLSGSPEGSLSKPDQVVLTESKAKLYFGVEDATTVVGNELVYLDSLPAVVSGIVADFEQPSDLNFTDFISLATLENSWIKDQVISDNWSNTNSSSQVFIKKMPAIANEQLTAQFNALLAENKSEDSNPNWIAEFKLQPLSDIHFNSDLGIFNHSRAAAHRPTLYALMGVAAILLLIASINFINLATAQALQRGKEVGVRKVLGSSRKTLITQFLSETALLTIFAVILSLAFSQLSFYYFKEFLPEGIQFQFLQPEILLFLLATIVVVSLLSGFYPAFVLSGFRPVLALKNQTVRAARGNSSALIRRGLIVFQFTVALVLIAGTFIIGRQINYMLNKDLGFDKEAIVYFYIPWRAPKESKQLLHNELEKQPEVQMISRHQSPPAANSYSTSSYKFDANGEQIEQSLHRKDMDENYLDLYGIELVAGRELLPSDTIREYIVNEKLVKIMGLNSAEEAIGKRLAQGEDAGFPIVGVVKDFHHQSLKEEIAPVVMGMNNNANCFSLKLNTAGKSGADIQRTLTQLEKTWNTIYTDYNFEYHFFDETIAKFYETERRIAKLMQTATGIVIFISCIGLFGLVSFSVVRRTREIGIRKVLGASVASIVGLLSKDFIKLVLIAVLIGSPIAWLLAQEWLSDFAYRIEVQWWMFVVTGILAIAIAFLTVSFQSIKAALANPVESLRNE